MHPVLDRRQHVVAIGAGLGPDLLQRQALLVDHLQRLAVGEHRVDAHVVAVLQQAGLARQQALGAAEQVAHRLVGLGHFLFDQRRDHQLAVLRHDLEAVVEDRHGGVHVQAVLALDPMGDRRDPGDPGQAQEAEQLDPGPAQVEFPLLHRQLGRVRVGVVVVVQLFAADEDAPGHQVGGGVAAFEVAIADRVAEAVDHAGGPERNPYHLHGPDGQAKGAEQGQVDERHQHHAADREARVEIALDPVVRAVLAVDAQGVLVLRLGLVQLRACAQDGEQALVHRAVRILDGLALGMVLTVDRGPFARVHPCGQPQPETEEVLQRGVQVECTVGGIAMQVDGHADDGDMRQHQGNCHQLPRRQVEKTVEPHRQY